MQVLRLVIRVQRISTSASRQRAAPNAGATLWKDSDRLLDYFTDPRMPCTKLFCRVKKMTSMGMVEMVTTSMMAP